MIRDMKRILAVGLWFYAFWYLGSMIAAFLGIPDLLGPALGLSAAFFVGVDPQRRIWARRATSAAQTGGATTSSGPAPNAA